MTSQVTESVLWMFNQTRSRTEAPASARTDAVRFFPRKAATTAMRTSATEIANSAA